MHSTFKYNKCITLQAIKSLKGHIPKENLENSIEFVVLLRSYQKYENVFKMIEPQLPQLILVPIGNHQ